MHALKYPDLRDVDTAELAALLNRPRTRQHLIEHPLFDAARVSAWIDDKLSVDATPGCRVRAVAVGGCLAGWCGIQRDGEAHELAIVLDEAWWGLGPRVFRELMGWAREMGLRTVLIRLLQTRPAYRFLGRQARRVYASEWQGQRFTTYELPVARAA